MEKNKIIVFCENTQEAYQIPTGSSLKEFKKVVFPDNHQNILGALVNNEVRDLHYEIYNPKYVNFIDVTTLDGYSVYTRSLLFVLYKAVINLFGKKTLIVEYQLSNGVFCRLQTRTSSSRVSGSTRSKRKCNALLLKTTKSRERNTRRKKPSNYLNAKD